MSCSMNESASNDLLTLTHFLPAYMNDFIAEGNLNSYPTF